MTAIVHVVQCLNAGGSGRALIATAKYSARKGAFRHRVLSLLPPEPQACTLALEAGLEVVALAPDATLRATLLEADIVQVHFWNSPELYRFLASPLPEARLLLWCHVAGDRPPQIVTPELLRHADFALMCSPYHERLAVFRAAAAGSAVPTALVIAGPDYARLDGLQPQPHLGFTVGYIGALDDVKLHPQLIELCAAVPVPDARFVVCGSGRAMPELQRRANALAMGERLQFLGKVEDIARVLASLDVFGYPLRPGNFAASELVLQEAMAAGVPPVVLDDGGAASMVQDGRTGLVVRTTDDYVRAIERLHADPALRMRLARDARSHARTHYGAANAAERMNAIYGVLMRQPRRARPGLGAWGGPLARTAGAELFVGALGDSAPAFATSLRSTAPLDMLIEADLQIAASEPALRGELTGGVFHYRAAWPEDPMLRFWSGLMFQGQGQHVRALAEFQRAAELGFSHRRIDEHKACSVARLRAASGEVGRHG